MSRPDQGAVIPAYVLLSHEWPAGHHRLIDRLLSSGSPVVIHVDKGVRQRPFARSDVSQVTSRVDVNWGGWTLVEALLRAMECALDQHPEATHLQILSGRDYPARPAAEFHRLLAEDPSRSFVAFQDMTAPGAQFANIPGEWCSLDLYAKLPFDADRLVMRLNRRLPDRAIPGGMVPYRGSAFACLSADGARYIVNHLRNPRNRALVRYFKTIRIPDEIVFPTVMANGPLAPTLQGWPFDSGLMGGLHYIDWTPTRENPAVLTLADYDAIVASGRFFVRKVGERVSDALVAALDARIGAAPQAPRDETGTSRRSRHQPRPTVEHTDRRQTTRRQ